MLLTGVGWFRAGYMSGFQPVLTSSKVTACVQGGSLLCWRPWHGGFSRTQCQGNSETEGAWGSVFI